MIEVAAARELTEQLRQIEERLERLLISGWRQARTEAADLRQEADALTEAGLPQVAARVAAVADAAGPTEALQAITLATNACRLLRARLPSQGVPDGWTPLTPTRKVQSTRTEALMPIARTLLGGQEVWVCTRTNRNELLLIDPPFPSEAEAELVDAPARGGIFGRLKQHFGLAADGLVEAPGFWLRRRLAGTLRWQAQHPLGAQGDVSLYRLDEPSWVAEKAVEQGTPAYVRKSLASDMLQDGEQIFWNSGGFRTRQLERDDPASYVWMDPTAAEAFGRSPVEKPWAVVWMEGAAIVPVALLIPDGRVNPLRLTHLIPGSPSDALAKLA
jgi:hypothetical protein